MGKSWAEERKPRRNEYRVSQVGGYRSSHLMRFQYTLRQVSFRLEAPLMSDMAGLIFIAQGGYGV